MTIRESLRELELWGAAAAFNLTEYTESNKCSLKLIKDWKDIVNQVDILTKKISPSFYRVTGLVGIISCASQQTRIM